MFVAFDKTWGLMNRVQTMVWAMVFAISHRFALRVFWFINDACEIAFEDIFPNFDAEQNVFLKEHVGSPGWLVLFAHVRSHKALQREEQNIPVIEKSIYCVAKLNC